MTFGSVDRRSIQLSYVRSDGEGSGRLVRVLFGGVSQEPMDKAGVVAFHENFYERWSTADMLGLLIQVGAVPPPGA